MLIELLPDPTSQGSYLDKIDYRTGDLGDRIPISGVFQFQELIERSSSRPFQVACALVKLIHSMLDAHSSSFTRVPSVSSSAFLHFLLHPLLTCNLPSQPNTFSSFNRLLHRELTQSSSAQGVAKQIPGFPSSITSQSIMLRTCHRPFSNMSGLGSISKCRPAFTYGTATYQV